MLSLGNSNSLFSLSGTTCIFISFWLFGLINNSLYVVILSSASDLVGPAIPKSLVLLFDITPSFMIKIAAPFFLSKISYTNRILSCILLSFFGMIILSSSTASKNGAENGSGSLTAKMFGIALASCSSGLGEVTFLSLTHHYKQTSLSAWSSGTGFAGIFGSFNFMLMTVWLNVSTRTTLFSFSILPFAFFLVYFKLLPQISGINDKLFGFKLHSSREVEDLYQEIEPFLDSPSTAIDNIDQQLELHTSKKSLSVHVRNTFQKIHPLIVPYMIPLTTVYFAEYLINQGVSPTLLYPIDETPFKHYRDIYVTYATLYQIGVFISRSSSSFFRIKKLYVPSVLQLANLIICILQALYPNLIPSLYLMFLLIFYEGLLGGASYVNTFMLITEEVPLKDREFALGTVSISDSMGIALSSLFGMYLETSLCNYQVGHGRDYCTIK